MIIPLHKINNETYEETIQQISSSTSLIASPGVCCSFVLRVYRCVFCSGPLLFVHMCVHMPLKSRSIVGVPSS